MPRLAAVLTPLQALGVVVGGTIGASIFLVPSVIAARVPSLTGVLLIWMAGAALSLASVLTLSELAAMLPDAGGGYVYIRAAFGPLAGFFFAWTDAVMLRPGAACTVGFTFGIYFAQLISPPPGLPAAIWQGGAAILLIAGLTVLNYRGAKAGADLQVAGMTLKAVALGSALLLPLILWHGPNNLLSGPSQPVLIAGFLAAMIPVMWTYGGIEQLAHLTEEVRAPDRNLPRVFTAGLLIIGGLYLSVSLGIHYVLAWNDVVKSQAVGADLFRALFGTAGATAISVTILLSAVITTNGALMSGPRSAFAVARNGDAPEWLASVHPRFGTPAHAVIATGCWAVILIALSVTMMVVPPPQWLPGFIQNGWATLRQRPLFDILISYVMFGYLLLQGMVAASLIVLRQRHPEWTRPFRVPAYPLVPILSMLATASLMISMAASGALEVLASFCLMLLGFPFYAWYRRSGK